MPLVIMKTGKERGEIQNPKKIMMLLLLAVVDMVVSRMGGIEKRVRAWRRSRVPPRRDLPPG